MLFWLDFYQTQSNLYKWFRMQRHDWSSMSPKEHISHLSLSPCTSYQLQLASSSRHWYLHIKQPQGQHPPTRAVVLESGLGLESGLETFFYRLGLVLDSLVFGLGLVSDLVIGLAKCSSWSRPSPAIYAFFFSFKTKTRLFRKWVM